MENDNDINNSNNNNREVFPNEGDKDVKAMQDFQQSFGEAKGILENNRMLIQEIDQTQEAHEPGSLSRNVVLLRELDNNIAHIMELYSNLSLSLSLANGSPADIDADANTDADTDTDTVIGANTIKEG